MPRLHDTWFMNANYTLFFQIFITEFNQMMKCHISTKPQPEIQTDADCQSTLN